MTLYLYTLKLVISLQFYFFCQLGLYSHYFVLSFKKPFLLPFTFTFL